MHGQAEPGLKIPSQSGLSEKKVLSKFLSSYQLVAHLAKGSRNSVADVPNLRLLPGLRTEQGAIFVRVVEPSEKRGGHDQIGMLRKSNPEFVVARHRPLRRDCSCLLVETSP